MRSHNIMMIGILELGLFAVSGMFVCVNPVASSFSKTRSPRILVLGSAAELQTRALPNAPNGYTPQAVDCPSTRPTIRLASGLSDGESKWIATRRNVTVPAMTSLLGSLNIAGFDAAKYIKDHSNDVKNLPNLGIAFSGGGYRAMLTGGGVLKSFDSRETSTGGLGGLLQSSTYVAGSSGGGWLVGSIFINNFTRISDLQASTGQLWNLTNSIFAGPDGTEAGAMDYYNTLGKQVLGKKDAGFDVSITDYWGRTLSFQFVNASLGGPGYTWSSIRDQPGFSTGDIPFPLIAADSRVHNQTDFPSSNTTVYEFGPYELGSWDPTTYGFLDLQYVGSNFTNGKIPDGQKCVRGYDNAGLVIGTTSSIFTPLAAVFVTSQVPLAEQGSLATVVQETKDEQGFVAHFNPNPYKGWNPTGKAADSESNTLYLVDGGTDNQNLPMQTLIQPARGVDIIVAVDSSNDVVGYPNGSSLYQTYLRSLAKDIANGTAFPMIPDTNTFVNLGLNLRPTFFGCNDTNSPFIVYIPNAPYTTFSNKSTTKVTYTYDERDAMIANGMLVGTQGNGTANAEFRACLGCAILSRSFTRTNTTIPAACQTCFNSYCWNGTSDSRTPATIYAPNLLGASPAGRGLNVTGTSVNSTSGSGSGSGGSGTGQNSTGSGPRLGAGHRMQGGSVMLTAAAAAVFVGVVLL